MNEALKNLVEETLDLPFDNLKFKKLVSNIFKKSFDENSQSVTVAEKFKRYAKNIEYVSELKDVDDHKIGSFSIELADTASIEKSRYIQRNIASWLISKTSNDALLVSFFAKDQEDWRLSFIQKETKIKLSTKGKIKIETEITPVKRFSYFVGKNELNNTAKQQIFKLVVNKSNNILSFNEAFSIENVTKQFYEDYRKLYEQIVYELQILRKKDEFLKEEFKKKKINIDTFSKKTLGQIIFLYFLQKKGWLGVKKVNENQFEKWGTGSKNFLKDLFLEYKSKKTKKQNFFNEILEPLFYDALNVERDNHYYEKLDCKIPFLNGGLFEPLNDYSWNTTSILISEELTEKIIETFDRYNFTVKEDEPLERDVAVDPEMLGKVFENLLPENLRKGKGSFYTPREIVQYMCRETLCNYLSDRISNELSKEDILNLFKIDSSEKENLIPLKKFKNEFVKIIATLEKIKICDPAIGSGAFPLTLMNEIIYLKRTLFETLEKKYDVYEIKRTFIENNLYGVDIDPGAIEIAKLRLWLSLVVDEQEFDSIKPLPNLEYKIMQGNSLIQRISGLDFDEIEEDLFNNLHISEIKDRLAFLQSNYFNTTSRVNKKEIKEEINKIFIDLLNRQLSNVSDKGKKKYLQEEIKNITQSSSQRNFFLWKVFFKEIFDNNGFDIVISNPPYIFARSSKEKGLSEEDKKYYKEKYALSQYQINTYILFFELGSRILNREGYLSYIVPNNCLTIQTNSDLREFILNLNNIQIANFHSKVFESADVDSAIISFNNKENKKSKISLYEYRKDFELVGIVDAKYFKKDNSIINFELIKNLDQDHTGILENIESNSQKLLFFSTVKSGLVPYEIGKGTPSQTKELKDNRIYHSRKKIDKTYMKILEGEDVQRYNCNWSGQYIKYGENLAAPRKDFNLYNSKRIVVRQIPTKPPYCIQGTYIEDLMLIDRNSMIIYKFKVSPLLILGILNSKIISYWFVLKFGKFQRDTFPQFKVNELAIFPFPKNILNEDNDYKKIIELVKRKIKDPEINQIDNEIDELVYNKFGLSKKDRSIIEEYLNKFQNN